MADRTVGGVKFGHRECVRSRRGPPARSKCRYAGKSRVSRGRVGPRDRKTAAECRKDEEAAATSQLDTSCFSVSTERLAQVMFTRVHCTKFAGLSLTCSRFTADYRYPENSFSLANNDNSINGYNHNYKLDFCPTKCKSSSRIFENELELSDCDTSMINEVLKSLSFVCNYDKMYTIQPSQLYFYQQNVARFNNISPLKIDHLADLGFEHLSMEDDHYKSNRFELSPEKNYYIHNDVDENRNYYQMQSGTPKNNECIYTENKYSPLSFSRKTGAYKYWLKRHMLFSKFDHGILLDEESLYSVCPEILSYHIAKRCKNDIALDPFCGAGGNIIQLAFTCKLVLAIDIDPNKIRLARHNAEIYGIADKIEFIVGDFFAISSMLKADVIYMSPPWGGPEYLDDDSFSIESICKKKYYGGFGIFDIVKKIAPSIAFHMPKTTNIYECLWLANDFGEVETQQNIINGKFNSITAFYGEFTNLTNNDY